MSKQQQGAKLWQGSANTYAADSVKDETELKELALYAHDYAHTIGLVCRTDAHKYNSDVAETPPLTLLPSPFPKELYDLAMSVQKTLNELFFRISNDYEFLVNAYKNVVQTDEFLRLSLEMMKNVHKEGIHQKYSLCVQRADYLTHFDDETGEKELKQVEVNPGQIGGPGHATGTSKLHRRMLTKLETLHGDTLPFMKDATLPENKPRDGMAQSIYKAWKLFADPKAVVVFVNKSDMFPICHFEQLRFVVFQLENIAKGEGHLINVLRMTTVECSERMHLDTKDFSLYADGNKKVAVVHMAYGYMTDHFPTEASWKTRWDMERSTAILSPNIRLQLAGTKKIQQLLSLSGTLERFFPNEPARLAELRKTYTQLWGLDSKDQSTLAAIQDAMRRPSHYVLKSQLEAGKGNFFDEEIPEMLSTLTDEEKGAHILQRKINPIVVKNYMLRPFKSPELENIVSEMGVFGSLIGNSENGKVLLNTIDGYLIRSKPASANQGGVTCGSGVIDSAILFGSEKFSTTTS